jgi:D-arabinose 1-dehydrogenase-like Zn-dependent alcohol dehydrogenase
MKHFMNAAVVPAAESKWIVKEVPVPKPAESQLLLGIRASGLCDTDAYITHGHIPMEFPRTIGQEPVEDIIELGPGMPIRHVGDRVDVPWIQASWWRCEWCQPLDGRGRRRC